MDYLMEHIIMESRYTSLLVGAMLAGAVSALVVGCKGRDAPPPTSANPPNTAPTAAPPPTTLGTQIDDSVVTTKVKSALLADPDVKGFEIKVETRKGEVQLSGFVDSQTQIDRAVDLARRVDGVTRVENNMTLKGGGATVGSTVDDGIVTTKVKTALLSDKSIKGSDVAVVTSQGQVQLSGYVDNQSQIDRAVEVTRAVEGVKSVDNKMSVKK
jgi:hyperosmotically inducible protein